jgi:hypothetical protein
MIDDDNTINIKGVSCNNNNFNVLSGSSLVIVYMMVTGDLHSR